jgi:hypothetical protein
MLLFTTPTAMTINVLHTISKAGGGLQEPRGCPTPRLVGFARDFVRRCQFEPTTCRRPSRQMAGASSPHRSGHRSDAVGGGGTIQVDTICRVAAN